MFAALFLPLLSVGSVSAGAAPDDPPVELWISNDRRFFPGEGVEVRVKTEEDGYLVVLHADPDGRVRVLFPLDPGDDNFVRGGKRYEVRGRADREAFEASVTGRGMVYAAVSRDPFRFDRYTVGGHWDYRALAPERLPREPEAELTELVRSMARSSFDYDVLTYDVIERVYASDYYRPYRHWAADVLCDPYYYDYYCRPYYGYGSYFSVSLIFGRPYRPYYYDPFFYDPFYYRPTYVYPRRYYSYPYYWYSPRHSYYWGNDPRRRGGDRYRDRRFTATRASEGYSWPSTLTPARRAVDRVDRPASRPFVERDQAPAGRRVTEPRVIDRAGERPVERREVEARRARAAEPRTESQPRSRPYVEESRPARREPEARRVERGRDDASREERGGDAEPRRSRPDDAPRASSPDEPRRGDRERDGASDRGGRDRGGEDRGAGRERERGGGGESRPSRSGGRDGGWGGGRRR